MKSGKILTVLMWSDADIFVSGHDHNKLHDFNVCYRREKSKEGKVYFMARS